MTPNHKTDMPAEQQQEKKHETFFTPRGSMSAEQWVLVAPRNGTTKLLRPLLLDQMDSDGDVVTHAPKNPALRQFWYEDEHRFQAFDTKTTAKAAARRLHENSGGMSLELRRDRLKEEAGGVRAAMADLTAGWVI